MSSSRDRLIAFPDCSLEPGCTTPRADTAVPATRECSRDEGGWYRGENAASREPSDTSGVYGRGKTGRAVPQGAREEGIGTMTVEAMLFLAPVSMAAVFFI